MKYSISTNNIHEKDLWGIQDMLAAGYSKRMAYTLFHRADVPTVRIGERIFIHRELFQEWLRKQAQVNA